MSRHIGRVLIYGGSGALGARCVSCFKSNDFWVISVDSHENSEADHNIIVDKVLSLKEQEQAILITLKLLLEDSVLDGVFCVAGGCSAGSLEDIVSCMDKMWKLNLVPSIISTSIATKHLKEQGIFLLTGSKAAMEPSLKYLPYSIVKNSIHFLVKSLVSQRDNGLPRGTRIVEIVPDIVMETPYNASPLDIIAEIFFKWSIGEEQPPSNMVHFVAKLKKPKVASESLREIGPGLYMEVRSIYGN